MRPQIKRRLLLSMAAVVIAAPLLLTPAISAQSKAKTIRVTLTDRAIIMSSRTAPAGNVIFVVKNKGKKRHNFWIKNKKTAALKTGKTAKLTVRFPKPGKFPYRSTLPGDPKKLKGVFTVTKAKSSAGSSTAAGKQVFLATGCGSCHVFKAANGLGTIGPNLDKSRLSRAGIVKMVTSGKGSMPSYQGQLTSKQIQDVSDFVFKERKG